MTFVLFAFRLDQYHVRHLRALDRPKLHAGELKRHPARRTIMHKRQPKAEETVSGSQAVPPRPVEASGVRA